MTARTAAVGIGALLMMAVLGAAAWMAVEGTSEPALVGLLTGVALGGLSLLGEALLLSWALRKKPSATLAVSLGGFVVRLVTVSVLTIVLHRSPSLGVSPVTFALAYVASFFAFLVLQVWAGSRVQKGSGGPGKGQEREESSR